MVFYVGTQSEAQLDETPTSLAAGLFLGASLTLPEGPFGRTKMPSFSPDAIARFKWDAFEALFSRSSLNFSLMYYTEHV